MNNAKHITITAVAPRAKALKTLVPRRIPPSSRTGIAPEAASTTWGHRYVNQLWTSI